MLTRATRNRYGVYGNENSMMAAKNNTEGVQKKGIVTRSRSALGDIKNRGFGIQNKAQDGSLKNKDHLGIQKSGKTCELIIEDSVVKNTTAPEQILSELRSFRAARQAIRQRFLVGDGKKFLDYENEDFGDSATIYPYAEPIFNYLQDRELTIQPLHNEFISSEGQVNPRMRYILINWLVQIHHSYKLQPETLYLCIAILDRYLLKHSRELTRDCFQLIGIASLFVAAKFEEMYPPDISDFTAVTHNAFSKSDIRNCEQTILQSIDFYLSIPIPLVYLRRLSRAVDADRTMHNLAKYLLELTIQEYDLAHLTGNMRAVVALCLSRALCLQTSVLEDAWCDAMSYLSGFTVDDIREPLRILARAAYRQNSPSRYRAIFDKYRQDEFYGRVATLPQLRSCLMETLADLKFDSDGELNAS